MLHSINEDEFYGKCCLLASVVRFGKIKTETSPHKKRAVIQQSLGLIKLQFMTSDHSLEG